MIWDYFFKKPQPQPEPLRDDVDISLLHWRGANGSKAKATADITSISRKGGNFYIKRGARTWKESGDRKCDSMCCFFVFRGGIWDGGKFDWANRSEEAKGTNHLVPGGYLEKNRPNDQLLHPQIDGEEYLYLEVCKADDGTSPGNERTRIIKGPW